MVTVMCICVNIHLYISNFSALMGKNDFMCQAVSVPLRCSMPLNSAKLEQRRLSCIGRERRDIFRLVLLFQM